MRSLLDTLPDLQPEAERRRQVKPFFPETTPEQRDAERAQLYKWGHFLLRNFSTLILLGAVTVSALGGRWEAANLIVLLMLWLKMDDIRVRVTVKRDDS